MATEQGSAEAARERLWDLAVSQRGYFTAAQAREAGYSHQAQRYHRLRGHWLRVDHGIYYLHEYLVLPGENGDHFARWTLWSHGRGVVSHTSALTVYDLGIANPAEIHLTVPPKFRKDHHGVSLHRGRLTPDEIEQHEGFRATTPTRAIVETSAAAMDQDIVTTAVADALERGLTTRQKLHTAAERLGERARLGVERAL